MFVTLYGKYMKTEIIKKNTVIVVRGHRVPLTYHIITPFVYNANGIKD